MSPFAASSSTRHNSRSDANWTSEQLCLIILRTRENELATIDKVRTGPSAPFEALGIQFKSDFQFVITYRDRIPDDKGSFSFELNSEINAGGFTVLDREAPHFVQLQAHAFSSSGRFAITQYAEPFENVTRKIF